MSENQRLHQIMYIPRLEPVLMVRRVSTLEHRILHLNATGIRSAPGLFTNSGQGNASQLADRMRFWYLRRDLRTFSYRGPVARCICCNGCFVVGERKKECGSFPALVTIPTN